MAHFFNRFSAAGLAFVFAFSSMQFSAENLLEKISPSIAYAERGVDEGNDDEGDGGLDASRKESDFSTLGKTQNHLTAQEMRGYQSLYEMQAELFERCVAKLKTWRGTGGTLSGICAEELEDMNGQGPDRLLLYDASGIQPTTGPPENWWNNVLKYWFGK